MYTWLTRWAKRAISLSVCLMSNEKLTQPNKRRSYDTNYKPHIVTFLNLRGVRGACPGTGLLGDARLGARTGGSGIRAGFSNRDPSEPNGESSRQPGRPDDRDRDEAWAS